MDWIKVEDSEIEVRDVSVQRSYQDDEDSGDDPLAPGNVTSTNGESGEFSQPTPKRGEKRKNNMSTNELYNNIKNRRNVVKRIAYGLTKELQLLEKRKRDIHSEFMQLKSLNEYYKKLEHSVLQIRQHKKTTSTAK
ncbi:uncharacterized protein LOC129791445 [Lutzomyia longipalpis]|uniref:uncharacterized protein LOC129791445 n=1 Tax=Lutzomyia longipalpis TaxID=7200 RepID=UPI0024838D83|nr:uncharacterized protein LOC129791445 [Lutzomyia longipalpis]